MSLTRREMLRNSLIAATAASVTYAVPIAAAPILGPAVPKTVEELRVAIESLFTPMGEVGKTSTFKLGEQEVRYETFTCGYRKPEVAVYSPDSFYPTSELAVAAMWNMVQSFKVDPSPLWSEEVVEDNSDQPHLLVPTQVYWRIPPVLVTTESGVHTVRMRAKFL